MAALEGISHPTTLLGGYLRAATAVKRVLALWRRERCWRTDERAHDIVLTPSFHGHMPPLREKSALAHVGESRGDFVPSDGGLGVSPSTLLGGWESPGCHVDPIVPRAHAATA